MLNRHPAYTMKTDPMRANARSGGVDMTILSISSTPPTAAKMRQKISSRIQRTK